jgi:hypothetical protein
MEPANPEMMQSMMGEMMKDGKTMAAMMQMMQQGGMMSKECMQSSMKMMDSKERVCWMVLPKIRILWTNLKSENFPLLSYINYSYLLVQRFSI